MSPQAAVFIAENIGIVLGYLFLALYVVPKATVKLRRTKFGGIGFFVTCAMTHFDQALHTWINPDEAYRHIASEWHMLLIHGAQVVFVWLFVTGLYLEYVRWGPWPTPTTWEQESAKTDQEHRRSV